MMFVGLLVVCGLLLSAIWTAGIVKWARRRKILDIPNARSSHSTPTPRGGGIAIVALTIVLWIVYLAVMAQLKLPFLVYVGSAILVAAVSWIDDVRVVGIGGRLSVHAIAAASVMMAFGYFEDVAIPFIGSIQLSWIGVPVTFLWITGFTNAYNFMDGIDGIAGGQAAVAGVGWAILCNLFHLPEIGNSRSAGGFKQPGVPYPQLPSCEDFHG